MGGGCEGAIAAVEDTFHMSVSGQGQEKVVVGGGRDLGDSGKFKPAGTAGKHQQNCKHTLRSPQAHFLYSSPSSIPAAPLLPTVDPGAARLNAPLGLVIHPSRAIQRPRGIEEQLLTPILRHRPAVLQGEQVTQALH